MSFFDRLLIKTHLVAYQLSGGFFGGRLGGQEVLLLSTTGRKSGKHYTIPVNYYHDGSNYVLVASNWGKDHHPGWYLNLKRQPTVAIQVKSRRMQANAREASGADYERLWQLVSSQNVFYDRYKKKTARKIPLVILTPIV